MCSSTFQTLDTVVALKDFIMKRTDWPGVLLLSGDHRVKDDCLVKECALLTAKRARMDDVIITNTAPVDCTVGEKFGLDVELEDGREVHVDGLVQYDYCSKAKRAVFEEAGWNLDLLDEYILVYYEAYMADDFQLNYFGVPWNGTKCLLRSKDACGAIYDHVVSNSV
eukprot:TRINITY_DN9933_c0_g1_i2.p1 TRINITY_DN9933_c0_g1~~TRINITY_DN9933_c0_g1_i2.p1  ORF type:complete len:167 (+),score=24.30 TRINITY_DN9933_c0_g1_i2:393-893(+)